MKKAIIIGIGGCSPVLVKMLNYRRVDVIGFSDLDDQGMSIYEGKPVFPIENIRHMDYDVLLVTHYPFMQSYQFLIQLGVDKRNIINANSFYNGFIEFNNYLLKSPVDLFITGLSYAYGCYPEALKVNAANLAYPSQDLFLDYTVARYVLDVQRNNPPKYAIIGLAYYSFNYEFIRTRQSVDERTLRSRLVLWPGLVGRIAKLLPYAEDDYERHLFAHHVRDVGEYLEQAELFNSPLSQPVHDILASYFNRNSILQHKKQTVDRDYRANAARKVSSKSYPMSVEYNVSILKRYLTLLQDHGVRPILVVHPQHPEYTIAFSPQLKNQFRSIMTSLGTEYSFQLIDCFESDMMGDMDFRDADHLDPEARLRFTEYLNNTIEW